MSQGVPTTLPNPFHTFPNTPSIKIDPHSVNIPQEKIDDLKRRINDAPKPRKTFENSSTDEPLGLTHEWLTGAIEKWKSFDWRKTEEEINSFPQFTADINHNGDDFNVHFMALFSKNKDAVPIVFTHGWPGSILEFLPLFHHLSKTYTPDTLPIHAIVPSLIGYGFSSPPPLDKDFTTRDNANVFDGLMRGLGFEKYIAQGGDVGSLVSRFLGAEHEGCKAVHVNMFNSTLKCPEDYDRSKLDSFDQDCLKRWEEYVKWEFAYKHEHATKSGTIGFVLESSPVALLSWVGEKFIVWSDETPPLETILADVTLYWLQNTIATGFYHYRSTAGRRASAENNSPKLRDIPLGYSLFKKEILPVPEFAARDSGVNLVWFRRHEKGGHFAALEEPVVFWEDVLDFTNQVWES